MPGSLAGPENQGLLRTAVVLPVGSSQLVLLDAHHTLDASRFPWPIRRGCRRGFGGDQHPQAQAAATTLSAASSLEVRLQTKGCGSLLKKPDRCLACLSSLMDLPAPRLTGASAVSQTFDHLPEGLKKGCQWLCGYLPAFMHAYILLEAEELVLTSTPSLQLSS